MIGFDSLKLRARAALSGALVGAVTLATAATATTPAVSAPLPVPALERDGGVLQVRNDRWRRNDRRHWRKDDRRHWRKRHRHGRNWVGPGIAGFAAGALLGGALAAPRYYSPQPRVVYVPRTYRPAPWTAAWYDYCEGRYRSFDPRSGTFLGYDGRRHFCR